MAAPFDTPRWKNISSTSVFDYPPGATFYRDLVGAERLLIGTHLKQIPGEPIEDDPNYIRGKWFRDRP